MQIYRPREYSPPSAWEAIDIMRLDDATVRLHWTDQPYRWHVNDGPEVFVVLDGQVNMFVGGEDGESCISLGTGDVFHAAPGDEHKAEPVGAARVLVVERAGSI